MIINQFKSITKLYPNKIAIAANGRSMKYSELDALSDGICNEITKHDLDVGSIVPILCERSCEFVVAVLGILKAGCIYMPIDVNLPKNRIKFMIDNAGCHIGFGNGKQIESIGNIKFVDLNNIKQVNVSCYRHHDNAYVMYTSGSQGIPKGVVIRQKGIFRLVRNASYISLSEKTRILATGSLAFDASTFEIFACILNGGTLYFVNDESLFDNSFLKETLKKHQINTIWFTSPFFNQIVDNDVSVFDSKWLKYLIIGGDVLSVKHVNQVLGLDNKLKIINGYGPTENTTFSATYEVTKMFQGTSIPIGKAITNSTIFVLTDDLKIAKIDEIGEIYLGGDGLMAGYLNDRNLTEEKLTKNPISKEGFFYKTGDLGYLDKTGNVNFVSRRDNQVKISGFRVELNEVKYYVNKFEGVVDSLPFYDRKNEILRCYVIYKGIFNADLLQDYLSEYLPEYMVPNSFHLLSSFPINSNGKIDYEKLPKSDYDTVLNDEIDDIKNSLLKIYSKVIHKKVSTKNMHDSFYALGGNSLKIIKLLHEVEKIFGVKVSIKDYFGNPTAYFLYSTIKSNQNLKSRSSEIRKGGEYSEASPGQRRFYFLQRLNKQSIAYNISLIISLKGAISKTRLAKILDRIISKHESLRTGLLVKDYKVYRTSFPRNRIRLQKLKLNGVNQKDVITQFIRPFDFKGPLLRIGILELNSNEKILIFDVHHSIFDGYSMNILFSDFFHVLNGGKLAQPKYKYRDYIEWQNSEEYSLRIKAQKRFWLSKFNNAKLPLIDLPLDSNRPKIFTSSGSSLQFEFTKEFSLKFRALAASKGVTNFMLFYSLFNVFLAKVSNQDDIIIGVPVSGRSHPDFENIIGLFVNTLPFLIPIDRRLGFSEFLEKVKNFSIQAFDNQDYPIEDLITSLNVDRDLSRNPLFDVLFSYNDFDYDLSNLHGSKNIKFEQYKTETKSTSFDLTFVVNETAERFIFTMEYYNDIFKRSTIERFKLFFINVSKAILANQYVKIEDIDISSRKVNEEIESKESIPKYPDYSIISLFNEQAIKSPRAKALIYKDTCLTYADLTAKVNTFAHYLLENNVEKGTIIAIKSERSIEVFVAMLGIMSAGCAYLPVDNNAPFNRIESILHNASVTAIVLSKNDSFRSKAISIKSIFFEDYISCKSVNQELDLPSPNSLAYIIYTSGSTGQPKGVPITHKSIVNTLLWRKSYYNYANSDTTLQIPSYFFDSSIVDIFTTLLSGASLVIVDEHIIKNVNALVNICKKIKVTNFLCIPSLYRQFLLRIKGEELDLRFVTLAGEDFSIDLVKQHYKHLPKIKLFNEYGPAECSVCATAYEFTKRSSQVLIGKPIVGMYCYVLNKDMQRCPDEMVGELYLSGAGLAKEYVNSSEESEKSFLKDPFRSGVMYKTGDLVKRLKNGNLKFVGRVDEQVKLRGIRIEVGEIEYQLMQIANINETVVVMDSSRELLHAYFTSSIEINVNIIKEDLSRRLPLYMVPTFITRLTSFPKTPSGKVNKKLLAQNNFVPLNDDGLKHLDDIKISLLKIWQSILKNDKITIEDNFFESGGNSINILVFQNDINLHLKIDVNITKFFQYPNIDKLGEYLKGGMNNDKIEGDETNDLFNFIDLFEDL